MYDSTVEPLGRSQERLGDVRVSAGRRALLLLCIYMLGLPLWWVLGLDFAMPLLLGGLLVCVAPGVHASFTPSDHLLGAVIVALGTAAYLNGFLLGQHTLRFAAALYNLSIWVCGLILLQQARAALLYRPGASQVILRTGFVAFLTFATIAWASFLIAYARRDLNLEMSTLFGLTLADMVPPSAALIRESATVAFTRPDWGLPGVPMPRIVTYGPYPTAAAAVTAILGSLALLHLHSRRGDQTLPTLAVEALIVLTLAITLTRSILAGWLAGAVVAALVFGPAWRRVLAIGLVAIMIPLSFHVDLSSAADYREYSTESRFENYYRAVARTLERSPVLGLGVKPREIDNHIAVGSHSTFVSAFTKGGALALGLVVGYLVLLPAWRWLKTFARLPLLSPARREHLRILLTLQIALWLWLCFEDLDAPATAAMLVFLSLALIEAGLSDRGGDPGHAPRMQRAVSP
ncbi:MAG: hypothetical protein ACM35H_00685 [Bacteroidota bacterium]